MHLMLCFILIEVLTLEVVGVRKFYKNLGDALKC
jgi:hypothetical protein